MTETAKTLALIDEIFDLLEAQIPANPNSPSNQRLKGILERQMRAYFKKLADAFPYAELERIYNRYVEKE